MRRQGRHADISHETNTIPGRRPRPFFNVHSGAGRAADRHCNVCIDVTLPVAPNAGRCERVKVSRTPALRSRQPRSWWRASWKAPGVTRGWLALYGDLKRTPGPTVAKDGACLCIFRIETARRRQRRYRTLLTQQLMKLEPAMRSADLSGEEGSQSLSCEAALAVTTDNARHGASHCPFQPLLRSNRARLCSRPRCRASIVRT